MKICEPANKNINKKWALWIIYYNWVQDPRERTAPVMPEAVMECNSANFVGDAGQLAQKICMEMEQMEACSQWVYSFSINKSLMKQSTA